MRLLEDLLTADGRALLDELTAADTDRVELRLAERLRQRYPADLVAAASTQVALRRRARAKFARADEMFFTRDGLEQASAEPAARHRADRLAADGGLVADLCTGIGGDLLALAAVTGAVRAVDVDPVHLRMAGLNAAVYAPSAALDLVEGDVRGVSLAGVRAAVVDPARRTDVGRLRGGLSEPPLEWCFALADRLPGVAVKAAPGLDLDTVPPGWEVEFVADGRDLKEAVLWSPALARAARRATVLGYASLVPVAGPPVRVAPAGQWLLDPNPAVTRAGAVEDLARITRTWKIDERVAFLSSDSRVTTPYARLLRVERSLPWDLRALTPVLRAADVGAADIRRRGLAGDVDAIGRKLRLHGTRKVTLAMTRAGDRPWALVCVEPDEPPLPAPA